MVVDNESDITFTLQSILEDNGFIVDIYTDPVLALRNFQANSYDVILLDIKMPDMDGFELYNKMKEIDIEQKYVFKLLVRCSMRILERHVSNWMNL